ncbi:MAG: hypothetical protein ACI910_002319 [Oleispira sp.]|jgi:hypothetical protein
MTDERRRFFRINDEAEISFKVITHDEYQAWGDGQKDIGSEKLAKLEAELSIIITNLKSQQHQLAKIFDLLNKKINIAMNSHPKTHGFNDNGELKPINLSACGIAFHTDQYIPKNAHILLQLKLKPSNLAIVTTGNVVGVGLDKGKHFVRVEFQDLSHSNQDLLIQHLFQVQSRALKKQRYDD